MRDRIVFVRLAIINGLKREFMERDINTTLWVSAEM